ncbi:winged helix-turn-helix domain-containing protein [Paenibacillus sp. DS2015]|uniref:winged helix-turn-helix domain-containing protein n=1 Tax=Paenibacillus sp. DS2015 TaxID=3373917 RepID=UPI003D1C4F5C
MEQACQRTFSIRGTSKLMHRMNLSYTKPTYTLATAGEAKQAYAKIDRTLSRTALMKSELTVTLPTISILCFLISKLFN